MSRKSRSQSNQKSESDQAIEQEIRRGQKFSMAAAIGQEAGDFLKGESPVPKLLQVKNELRGFVGQHLADPSGALQAVLQDLIQSDDVICSRYFDAPLQALVELLRPMTVQDALLQDLVRRVDMRWGEIYDERPRFQQPGQPPHPEDEYTYESVRQQLIALLAIAEQQQSSR
ncbi:MAG: hypothetical protein ACFB0G_16545 [Leptolyngbyaceae cyanobacterium]